MRFAASVFFCALALLLPSASHASCTASGTSPSVTICAPTSSAVSTTFHVSANTLDSASVTAMKIYIDGVSVYQTSGSFIETDITVTAGTHSMTVKAWDAASHVLSKSMSIQASAGGGNAPCALSTVDPSVTICTPANGATVPTEFEVVAGTTDSANSIQVMQIFVDGTADYTFHDNHLDTNIIVSAGTHAIMVQATDSANRVFSKTVSITATTSAGNCQPTSINNSVNICAPTNGSTVTSPVTVSAAASSSQGVKTIKLYLDGTSVYSTTASFVDTSLPASNGTHKLTVKAWNGSNIAFSSSVNFTVSSSTGGGNNPEPISPAQIVLTYGETQQFASQGATTWSVDGVAGGSASTGTIDANGLYTAPSTAGKHTVTAIGSQTANATVYVENVSMLTYHFDNGRDGANTNEIALSSSNVNVNKFGRLAKLPIDADVHGSPLVVPGVNIPGVGVRNVVYLATEHDSVYAFDADGKTATPYWKVNFTNAAAGVTTMPASDTGTTCCVAPEVGITSTPVIDTTSGTIYVLAATKENGAYIQRLHALDITTGAERSNSPVLIDLAVPGTAPEHDSNGLVHLNPLRHMQRSGLLLANGKVYIAWASFNDIKPYHGWVAAYDAQTLSLAGVFNTSPNGWGAGIWQAGGGPSADAAGNVYVATGNGTFTAASGGADYGQSVVRLNPDLSVGDYFTPNAYNQQNSVDQDLGSGGAVLLPNTSLLVNVNKSSTIYLLNQNNLGKLGPSGDTQIPQEIHNEIGLTRAVPSIWNNNMYVASLNQPLQSFHLTSSGNFQTTPVAQTSVEFPFPGASPFISANGTSNGIVWALRHSGGDAILYAFDATTLAELYDSGQNASRDAGPVSVRFAVPTVVNGHVYVVGKDALAIYGLLP